VVIICYIIFIQYNVKEGATSCESKIPGSVKFHSEIGYKKFEELAKTKKFADAFKALNSRTQITKHREKFRYKLSIDKRYLKVKTETNVQYVYEIKKKKLELISKCSFSGETFTTISKEGFGEVITDLIKITSNDFAYFIENPLFNLPPTDIGYSFMNDPTNCVSLNIDFYGNDNDVNENCPSNPGYFKLLKNELDDSSCFYLCTAETHPTDYKNAKNVRMVFESERFKNKDNTTPKLIDNNANLLTDMQSGNQYIYAANYILKTKLQTDIVTDPYVEFEGSHENLQLFTNNFINIASGKSKNKIYGWIGPSS
jgi:hypothetical protein